MAEGESQSVMSPLFLRALSYSDQLVTRYFCLYLGLRFRLCASFIGDSSGWRSLMGGGVYVREMAEMFMHQRHGFLELDRAESIPVG